MKNGAFVIWMLVYPLVNSITYHVSYLEGERFDHTTVGLAALITIAVWAYVGTKLYEGKQG